MEMTNSVAVISPYLVLSVFRRSLDMYSSLGQTQPCATQQRLSSSDKLLQCATIILHPCHSASSVGTGGSQVRGCLHSLMHQKMDLERQFAAASSLLLISSGELTMCNTQGHALSELRAVGLSRGSPISCLPSCEVCVPYADGAIF